MSDDRQNGAALPAEEALRRGLALAQFIATASSRLVNVPSAELDVVVNELLAGLCALLRGDRAFFFRVRGDLSRAENTHEWCGPGVRSQIDELRAISTAAFPWAFARMAGGDPLWVRAAGLPPEASAERRLMEESGTLSAILVPIRHGGQLIAFIGLDAVRAERSWPEEEIRLLRTVGEMFVSTLVRREAELALRAGEEQFRAMFELAAIGMGQADPRTGRFVRVNQKLCAITGYSADELVGMDFRELTHPDDRAADWEIFQQVVTGRRPEYHREKRYVRKDGTVIWVNVNSAMIRDPEGRVVRTVATIDDVTWRKEAEEALRRATEREQFLAEVVENSTVAFVMGFPDGRLGVFNRAYAELTGYSREELVDRNVTWALDLTPPEWRAIEAARLAEAVRTRQPVFYEKEYVRKDGSRVPIEIFVQAILDAAGEPVQYRAFLTDITERKRAEQVVRESEERLRALTDNVPVPIQGYQTDGTVTYWNRASEKVYGYSAAEAVGSDLAGLIVPPEAIHHYRRALELGSGMTRSGQFMPSGELILRRKDGGTVHVHSTHTAVCMPGRPPSLFCLDVDLSEQKSAEAALRRQADELKAMNEELTRFNRVAVDRELRMIELKREINDLRAEAGRPPRYRIDDPEALP